MLDFMVIGLPRSGTTWVSNWLNTDTILCFHDPLYSSHFEDWNTVLPNPNFQKVGVSCTGIWRWVDWVNAQPCNKLILERPISEVQESLDRLDFPLLTQDNIEKFKSIEGPRVSFSKLVSDQGIAKEVWSYLTNSEFNPCRFQQLREYNIQPNFGAITPDPIVTAKLYRELSSL